MKNPVTFSISEARKVQRKRQIRYIIVLCSVIFLLLLTLLIVKVNTMKNEADILYPTTAVTSVSGSSGAASTPSSTQAATGLITSTPTPTSPSLPTPTASSGTTPSGTPSPAVSPPPSTAAPSPAPEVNVYIPESGKLQTVTHNVRDSGYHELQKKVQGLIDTHKEARCGFYYINLKNGEQFGYNDMVPFVVGSSINLPVNILLYDQVKAETISLLEIMKYTSSDTVSGPGTIQNTVIGSQHYIRELSSLSISGSDNTATAMLLRRLGGIDSCNDSMKLISDIVDFRTISTYTDYAKTQQSGKNRTSTQDLAKYMEYFYRQYLGFPVSYQPLFNDLAHSASEWSMNDGLPAGVLVCHKTGSNAVFHSETDTALVFAEEPYVLCISVESADPGAAHALQKELAGMVYAYLHGCYS